MTILEEKKEPIAKQILDKWATLVNDKDSIWTNADGVAQVNQDKTRNYNNDYSGNEVLWVAPKDSLVLEFEDIPEKNRRYISEIESAAKSLRFDYCITGHGGKSDYFRMFNIKGLPLGDDNKQSKMLLIDLIMPSCAKNELDRTNLGWTLSPVIEHPHWKPKYNGAIHKILRGKNPLQHENLYPKELKKQLTKSKSENKKHLINTKQNDSWVEDFLLNYCCNNELPSGSRHFIIEKNLAAFILYRQDKEEVKKKYYEAQKRQHDSLRTWETAILKGDYTQVSAGELYNFIKEHNLNYLIPKDSKLSEINNNINISNLEPGVQELKFLTNPKMLEIIKKELDKKIEGEEKTKISVFLCGCGAFVKKHQTASYNLCINSNSGAGKSFIAENTFDIFPKSMVLKRSRISPNAFTYWHSTLTDPSWSWEGKILLLNDISNNILNHDVFKVMCSDQTHSTIVIDQVATDIQIKGKPVMYITTASADPNNEMLRRFPMHNADESINQTKAIMKRQALAAMKGESLDYNPLIVSALGKLKRVNVMIPFAYKLIGHFPSGHIIMRTHFQRLLDYIKASAALHQYQREHKEDFIIAEPQDYDNAVIIMEVTTSNKLMLPLTQKQKTLLKEAERLNNFCTKDIEPYAPYEQKELYKQLHELTEKGFLTTENKSKEGYNKPIKYYTYQDMKLDKIPKWSDIEKSKPYQINIAEFEEIGKLEEIKEIKEIKEIGFNSSISSISLPKLTKHISSKEENNSHEPGDSAVGCASADSSGTFSKGWDDNSIWYVPCSVCNSGVVPCNEIKDIYYCKEHFPGVK